MPAVDRDDPGRAFEWGDWIDALTRTHGSLARLALELARRVAPGRDPASIERGLRRLRARGTKPGGEYGALVARAFGLPAALEARLRWLGLYHGHGVDLPPAIAADLLRAWDRPPVSESPARAWIALGLAQGAIRRGSPPEARAHLERITAGSPADARLERALVLAYVCSREGDDAACASALDEAAALLEACPLSADDRACFAARLLDQRGHAAARVGDLEAAASFYEAIADAPAYAACRRALGLAYVAWRRGDAALAARRAREARCAAGDGGFVRLRAVALALLARIVEGDEAARCAARAHRIATDLGDRDLLGRWERS